MTSQRIKVMLPTGLHARPAGKLAIICTKCNSEVIISVGEKRFDPKSILNIMAAAIKCGTEIVVECTGKTEKEDLKVVIDAIEGGLGE